MVDVRRLELSVGNLSPALSGLRIAHVSDLHFRRWNRVVEAAQDLLLTLDYDLLVATGDFGTGPHGWRRAVDLTHRFFEPISYRVPVYGVLGNHDAPDLATRPDSPLVMLNNESVLIEQDGAVVEIAGVDQRSPQAEDLNAALGDVRQAPWTILLAHYPSTVYRLPAQRVDLQLSGHTHGGQIRFPGLGCVWTNDRIPRRLSRGLHVVGDTFLHVSPGLGVSPPIPVRINCPPEVTLLTLQRTDPVRRERVDHDDQAALVSR